MVQKVCLNMIVKNEIKVIERCLRSVTPFIDYWVIVDTGSTDGTQEFIRDFMKNIPGELHERPWKNFGHNRTEALELVPVKQVDYIFTIDADEELILPRGYRRPQFEHPAYYLMLHYGGIKYKRMALVSTLLPWRYEGVLHEYITSDRHHHTGLIEEPHVLVHQDFDEDAKTKYSEHARILEEALAEEPKHARNTFYLAQSYRDSGHYQKAYENYEKRTELGGWVEEIWYSYFQMAILSEFLNKTEEEVVCAYLKAYQYQPNRAAESLGKLMSYLNRRQLFTLSALVGKTAVDTIGPKEALFLEHQWHRYLCKNEYALAAYYTNDFKTSYQIWKSLQHYEDIPDAQKEQIKKNLAFAESKLGL